MMCRLGRNMYSAGGGLCSVGHGLLGAVRLRALFLASLVLDDLSAPISAGEKGVPVGHLISVLSLCRHVPDDGGASCDGQAEDHRVCFPVVRLRIPPTGGRPDVFRIGDLAASTHVCGRR